MQKCTGEYNVMCSPTYRISTDLEHYNPIFTLFLHPSTVPVSDCNHQCKGFYESNGDQIGWIEGDGGGGGQMPSFYILRGGKCPTLHTDKGANVHPCHSVCGQMSSHTTFHEGPNVRGRGGRTCPFPGLLYG